MKTWKICVFILMILTICTLVFGQSSYHYKVTGTVRNRQGQYLPNVSVMIVSTRQGMLTDSNGQYHLDILSSNKIAKIEFSMLDYASQEVKVKDSCQLEVFLTSTKDHGMPDLWPIITTYPSRNAYKINGITVAGGNGEGNADDQINLNYHSNTTDSPYAGVCVDSEGNVYVADSFNKRIQKWQPGAKKGNSIVTGVYPKGIFLDGKGYIYFSDLNGFCQYNMATNYSRHYGSSGNGEGEFDYPKGISVDQSGYVYVVDSYNNRVQKWVPGSEKGTTVAGSHMGQGVTAYELSDPEGVFVDPAGNIYIADYLNNRVQKWVPGAEKGTTVASVNRPKGVFVDQLGNVFVSEQDNNSVQKWAPGATVGVIVAGGNGHGDAASELSKPTGIWLDAAGNLYVADNGNNRVQKFESDQTNAINPQPKSNKTVVVYKPPVKPAPEYVDINFNWQKPVSDFMDLPDSSYHTQVGLLPVKIRINSNIMIDQSKIELLLNGHILSNYGKTRLVDLKQINRQYATARQFEYEYGTTVDLQEGSTNIQLLYDGSPSDILNVIYKPETLNLYVLSIGTNNSLQFAVKDAFDFAGMFSSQSSVKKYFNSVHSETLVGLDAKAINIVDKVSDLAQKEFKPNDVLLIFISSHGKDINNEYRIMGSDFDPSKLEKTSVNFQTELLEPLKGLACKKFIFLDACYSGGSILNKGNKTPNDLDITREVNRMVTASDSVTIITSSSKTQESWEDPKWQNGAFTKALKEALQEGKADTDHNGIIDINELFTYISWRVPQLVKEVDKRDDSDKPVTQTPEIKNPKGNVSIYVY